MIADYYFKVKSWIEENKADLYVALVIFLVGLASFGLGRLSALWPVKKPIVIEEAGVSENAEVQSSVDEKDKNFNSKGKYVASKNGTAYHLPWCPGALRIKEENRLWFKSREEAEKAGYHPAANCKGL